MIKTLDIELKIIIYIIAYGIYYYAVSDIVIYIENIHKLKLIPKALLEIFYLIIQIYITYEFCFNLDNGYIPIYFLLFIIIGFLLYYIFMKDYLQKLLEKLTIIRKKITPLLIHFAYSKAIWHKIKQIIVKILKKIKHKIKKNIKKKQTENQNT